MTDERIRSAFHESAHAVLATDAGRIVHAITLRRGLDYSGITTFDHDPPELAALNAEAESGGHIFDLSPPAMRHALLRMIEILAGHEAAELVRPKLGRVPDLEAPPEPQPAKEPPPEVAERLRHLESEPPADAHDDNKLAYDGAFRHVGIRAGTLRAWLREEARDAVLRRWPVIERVADELLRRDTLTGPDFLALYTRQGD